MKAKIAVTGGKGGTGKSTIAVNLALALLNTRSIVLADLDVEAPNDYILLGARLENEEPVKIMLPFIDYSKCTRCGVCAKVCDTGAIILTREKAPFIIPRLCSGCRACYYACPYKAVLEGSRIIGYTYYTKVRTRYGILELITGVLREGEEHTPPVVLAAKKKAETISKDILLVDTSAGTASHVAIALKGSDIVLAVTEPTPLGLHDLEMILELASTMHLESWVIVNKHGIGSNVFDERLNAITRSYGAKIISKIPYSTDIVYSYVNGKPIVEYNPEHPISKLFFNLANKLLEVV